MDKVLVFIETYQPFRHIVVAILILFLGHRLVRLAARWIERAMTQAHVEATVTRFISNISYFVMFAIVIIITLGQLGIQTTSLLAMLSAAGLAIGLALQGSLANLAAGLLLIIFRPFKVGDFIEAAGVQGTVQEVHILTTIMHSIDNLRLIVPNSQIMSSIITNYSVTDTRRVALTITVSYDDDLQQVKQLLHTLVAEHPLVLKEPAPVVGVSDLAESGINFAVRVWVQRRDVQTVQFDLREQIKRAFDQHGITMPYPQRTVYVRNGTGLESPARTTMGQKQQEGQGHALHE
jgi:small conductance mechanosensitive channel